MKARSAAEGARAGPEDFCRAVASAGVMSDRPEGLPSLLLSLTLKLGQLLR
jgi:hypothetical protein